MRVIKAGRIVDSLIARELPQRIQPISVAGGLA
jgi:hypothetical protein